MSKAAELAALIGSQSALSNRNLIINGAMQVAQRGTSVSSDGYGAADRWRLHTSGATVTLSQQSLTVGQTDLPSQFRYYTRLNVTTSNDFTGVSQRIEDVQVVSGQSVTVSFYAKGTNPGGGSIRLNMRQNFGSGGSSVVDTDDTFSVTSSWQRFEKTISLPSISGKTIGTGSYLQCKFDQGSDTSTDAWTLDITGVQLEVGEQATPFEHRSFGDELRRCQRYYFRQDVDDGDDGIVNTMANWNGQNAYCVFMYPVEMRVSPTGSHSGVADFVYYSDGQTRTPTAVNTSLKATKYSAEFSITWDSPLNAGGAGWLRAVDTDYFLAYDAEL